MGLDWKQVKMDEGWGDALPGFSVTEDQQNSCRHT